MSAPAATTPAGHQRGTAARRDLGAFYTPEHVVNYMVSRLEGLGETSTVLEPAGGDGAFVRGLIATGRVTPDQVHVWDIDASCREAIEGFGGHFVERDGLLGDEVCDSFTHVIGNPPYLSKQSTYIRTNRDALHRRFREIGANDTYAMFTLMALRALRPGGMMAFLVSDTFMTLGSHRRLREVLLRESTIVSLTLLPRRVFPDAAVATAIIVLRRVTPSNSHAVSVYDLRGMVVGEYPTAATATVAQSSWRASAGSEFSVDADALAALTISAQCPALVDLLDGGLGMYTKDNGLFLGVVTGSGVGTGRLRAVASSEIDGTTWRYYHKRGGATRWWAPAEHCVRWDAASRGRYVMPATALAGRDAGGRDRDGFIVSGISSRLSARPITPGAMWESNKAFGFFPRDPVAWPVEFFLAVLNSTWYAGVARALNHTVSLQIRDLKALPLLPFTPRERQRLADLGRAAVARARAGQDTTDLERRIDRVVERAVARVAPTRGDPVRHVSAKPSTRDSRRSGKLSSCALLL